MNTIFGNWQQRAAAASGRRRLFFSSLSSWQWQWQAEFLISCVSGGVCVAMSANAYGVQVR
jgi:hypothetical protein